MKPVGLREGFLVLSRKKLSIGFPLNRQLQYEFAFVTKASILIGSLLTLNSQL